MTIGKRIKKIRLQENMYAYELAEVCCVTQETVSRWENDRCVPSLYYIDLIAKTLKTTVDYILYGDEKPVDIQSATINKTIVQFDIVHKIKSEGFNLRIIFNDKSELKIDDCILYKKPIDKYAKEIII